MSFVLFAFVFLSLFGVQVSYAQYCDPQLIIDDGGFRQDQYIIRKVQIGEVFNQNYEQWNINNSAREGNIHDYTYLPPALIFPGRVFNVLFDAGYPWNQGGDDGDPGFSIAVYVDWNQDGDFDDPGEEEINETESRSPFIANIRVADDALVGTVYRIRVMMTSSINANITPCGDGLVHDYEDYSIEVGDWTPYSTDNSVGTAGACDNMGFEDGSYNNWRTFTGMNYNHDYSWSGDGSLSYGCCDVEELAYGNVDAAVQNVNPWQRHTIVTVGADPLIGGLINVNGNPVNMPRVPPDGGNFAARIGQAEPQNQAERITSTFTVTEQNAIFIYDYAIIMDEPGHASHEQPSFQASLYDANGRVIPCSYQRITSGIGYDFKEVELWQNGPIISYKEWERVFVNLWDYIGQGHYCRI